MRIRFLRDEVYEAEGRMKGPRFHKGAIIDARQDFAGRWLRRGAAELMPGGKDPGDELFVRVKGDDKADAIELAHQVSEANANGIRTPTHVERRGVKYFAMAGDERLGEGMDLAAAQAFAAANGELEVRGAPKSAEAPVEGEAEEPPAGRTLPDGTAAAS